MVRQRPPALARPHLDGEKWALAQRDVALPGRLRRDADARARSDPTLPAVRPVLVGSWADGSAARNLARLLADLGWLDDRTAEGWAGLDLGPISVPSVAVGAAAGTGGSVGATITEGNDRWGVVQVVTGNSGLTTGTLATITFGAVRSNANYVVVLTPSGTAAATEIAKVRATNRLTTAWNVNVVTTLTANTTYTYYFSIED
jgi:hypothetical protein